MVDKKMLSVLLVSTLAACSGGGDKAELVSRTPEQRCLELEHRWDTAQQSLVKAESRNEGSWLYSVADTFNPLTNNSSGNLELTKKQEQRARENYAAFGCMDLNKMKIESAFRTEVPMRGEVELLEPAQQLSNSNDASAGYQEHSFGQQLGYQTYNQAPAGVQDYAQNSLFAFPPAQVSSQNLSVTQSPFWATTSSY